MEEDEKEHVLGGWASWADRDAGTDCTGCLDGSGCVDCLDWEGRGRRIGGGDRAYWMAGLLGGSDCSSVDFSGWEGKKKNGKREPGGGEREGVRRRTGETKDYV